MTVICWDGVTLAADRQMVFGTQKRNTTKIFRLREDCNYPNPYNGALIGFAGDAQWTTEVLNWFETFNADPNLYPVGQKDEDKGCYILLITKEKKILWFHNSAYPTIVENEYHALGSGSDFALASMYWGKTARQAVEAACDLDSGCGMGIDELTFESL